jgi:hypothetical protein
MAKLGVVVVAAAVFALVLAVGPSGQKARAAGDPVLVGAGDIASCSSSGDEATAKLLDGISGTVFTTGDNAYPDGTAAQFRDCYGPSWGRHKDRTRPSVGNHEYDTPGAAGYFDYFGTKAGPRGKGYYSYDRGEWHIVVLNSMCEKVGGCHEGSAQETWLKADLAAHPNRCTLAYFHEPLFSSGSASSRVRPFWRALYRANAEVVLGGHIHAYERFRPMEPDGDYNPSRGIREFVVGTGGASHNRPFDTVAANSVSRKTDAYGVLKLTLHAGSYEWKFVPVAGETFTDSGTASCH